MTAHPIEVVEAGRALVPHSTIAVAWSEDGISVGPDVLCEAWSRRNGMPCSRMAVLELETTELVDGDPSLGSCLLCGGHFNLHRSGREVILA